MSIETKNNDKETVGMILSLLSNGYDDYLASRTLLNHNLILQGAILANTAIEKYFKSILIFAGNQIKYTHSIMKMLPQIKNFDVKLYNKLNIDFMVKVDSCYVLRYIDSAPQNFKITLQKKQILSELDFTISTINEKINISSIDGRKHMSKYSTDRDLKIHALVNNNYLFQNTTKEIFLTGTDYLHEIMIDSNKNFIEFKYQTDFNSEI